MGKINVPQDFFHCPELSKREKQYLVQKAQDSAKALVEGARSSNGPIRWIEAGITNGVQMYKGEARNPSLSSGEQINYACGATTINATLEEAADFFDLSSTDKMKDFAATQNDVTDGVVLYTLAAPSAQNNRMHQITVKWMCITMPSSLIKDRDFLTLECQDVFTDSTGRRGWVRSYHSVKLPCCPDLQSELGFVRGSLYHTGYVFVESERPGWLDCIYSCQVNFKGNLFLPPSLHFVAMKSRIGSVSDLGRFLQERRLGKQKFLSDLELVPKNQRSRCQICAVKFGMLTRKTRCRKCGEVVCHQCSLVWDINVPKYGIKKVRVCTKCSATTDKDALENISMSSDRLSVSIASEQQTPPTHLHDTGSEGRGYGGRHHPSGGAPSSSGSAQRPAPGGAVPPPPLGRGYSRGERLDEGSFERDGYRRRPSYDQGPYRNRSFIEGDYGHPHPGAYGEGYEHPPPRGYGRRPDGPPEYVDEYGNPTYGVYGAMAPRDPRDPRTARYYDPYYQEHGPPPHAGAYHGYPPPGAAAPPPYYSQGSMDRTVPRVPKDKLRGAGTDETASSSSDFSASHASDDMGLTAKALEEHTRQMGRPGPVARPNYPPPPPRGPYHMPPAPHPEDEHSYYQGQYYRGGPPPPAPYGRHPMQPLPEGGAMGAWAPARSGAERRSSYGPDYAAELYREYQQGYPPREDPSVPRPAGAESPQPDAHLADARSSSSKGSGKRQQPPPKPVVTQNGLSFSSDNNKAMSPQNSSEETQEEGDEFNDDSIYSPVSKAIADNFSTLLRTDENRSTMDSYRFSVTSSMMEPTMSFCDSINDYSVHHEDDEVNDISKRKESVESDGDTIISEPTRGNDKGDEKKVSVVQLYQQILELTKQQHALDSKPEADSKEKDSVAQELRSLYQQLNQMTMNPEIEL